MSEKVAFLEGKGRALATSSPCVSFTLNSAARFTINLPFPSGWAGFGLSLSNRH
jgi:hypothetical protein